MGGRVALVTGGSRGIGAAVSLALARDGHRVALGYRSDEAGANSVGAVIEETGGSALAVQADVADATAVDRAVTIVEEAWGPVEVLVNNAGVTRDGLLMRMGDEQWAEVVRTNLDGAFHAVRRVTPAWSASICSIAWSFSVKPPASDAAPAYPRLLFRAFAAKSHPAFPLIGR